MQHSDSRQARVTEMGTRKMRSGARLNVYVFLESAYQGAFTSLHTTFHPHSSKLPSHTLSQLCHGTEIGSILYLASIQNLIAIPLSFLDDIELQSRKKYFCSYTIN